MKRQHTNRGKFENATISGHFGFVFEQNSFSEITWLLWRHRFRKASFSKCFPATLKRKVGVFKFLQFEEHFRKAPFSWRISVDGRPNRARDLYISCFVVTFLTYSLTIGDNKPFLTFMWNSLGRDSQRILNILPRTRVPSQSKTGRPGVFLNLVKKKKKKKKQPTVPESCTGFL